MSGGYRERGWVINDASSYLAGRIYDVRVNASRRETIDFSIRTYVEPQQEVVVESDYLPSDFNHTILSISDEGQLLIGVTSLENPIAVDDISITKTANNQYEVQLPEGLIDGIAVILCSANIADEGSAQPYAINCYQQAESSSIVVTVNNTLTGLAEGIPFTLDIKWL